MQSHIHLPFSDNGRTEIDYIVCMAYSKIRWLMTFNPRARGAAPKFSAVPNQPGLGNKKALGQLVEKGRLVEEKMRNALIKASKSAFAQDYFDQIAGSGAGPEQAAMSARDMSSGNMGSDEIKRSDLGYVFSANADACPRCLMFDGTWVASPIDAQLLSHPGCRCSVVPRADYHSYESQWGVSTEEAAQENKDYGHSEELAPWAMLKKDKSYWGVPGASGDDIEDAAKAMHDARVSASGKGDYVMDGGDWGDEYITLFDR